jgi:uncharacterized protein with ATP-grasp and redox domains
MGEKTTFHSAGDLRYGKSPKLDAWLLHFMTENNLEYLTDPQKNASPEQLRFMVALLDDQVFAPCTDNRLPQLLSEEMSDDLRREYEEKWLALVELAHAYVGDQEARERILELCRYKYKLVQASPIIIPSRLMKRFITILLTQSGLRDPYQETKREYNRRAFQAARSGMLEELLNVCPAKAVDCERLDLLRFELDMLEMGRLLMLSTASEVWTNDSGRARERFLNIVSVPETADATLRSFFAERRGQSLRILFLPDTSGGLIFDLLVVRALIRQGHKVILALKEGFHFASPVFWDWEADPDLAEALEGANYMPGERVSKNELLSALRENSLNVISDGTREELNLYRTSVTFARAWKEADLVMAKGVPHHRRLIATSQSFTRDVLCHHRDAEGKFRLDFKPKASWVRKFRERDLSAKAESIVNEMRVARQNGQSVMFYSAIIGSVPGQTRIAIKVVDAFVRHLRERLDSTHVINPAEHFEEGMDADDLMYMWEKVQRSGMLDVWRFQTVADIEKSFELLGMKVPPVWAGKDATFSTGCTKEMRIALDMQKKNPEMQIIGPDPARFFRRQEYGVGKFYDAAIE